MSERINDEQLDIEIKALRNAVDRIDYNGDLGKLFRDGQYILCRLVYVLSRSDKLTAERQAEVDNIVSIFDDKLRPALRYYSKEEEQS